MDHRTGFAVTAADSNSTENILEPPLDLRESAMVGEWPLRSFAELDAHPAAVRSIRRDAHLLLREWGFTKLADDCALVVSELLTNSLQASYARRQFTTMRLWLLSDKETVLVLVWDAIPQSPKPTGLDTLAESGRGLHLVGLISEQWSWYPAPGGGKVVWALCGGAAG